MTEFGLWREPIRRLISKISCLAPIYRAQNKNFFVEEFICLISRFLRKPLSNILCWLANNITTCLSLDTFGRTMKPGEGKLVDLYFPKFSWGNSWRVFQLEICLFWAFSKANSSIIWILLKGDMYFFLKNHHRFQSTAKLICITKNFFLVLWTRYVKNSSIDSFEMSMLKLKSNYYFASFIIIQGLLCSCTCMVPQGNYN